MSSNKENLLIIGNGFDLESGLDTTMSSFIRWLIQKEIREFNPQRGNYDDIMERFRSGKITTESVFTQINNPFFLFFLLLEYGAGIENFLSSWNHFEEIIGIMADTIEFYFIERKKLAPNERNMNSKVHNDTVKIIKKAFHTFNFKNKNNSIQGLILLIDEIDGYWIDFTNSLKEFLEIQEKNFNKSQFLSSEIFYEQNQINVINFNFTSSETKYSDGTFKINSMNIHGKLNDMVLGTNSAKGNGTFNKMDKMVMLNLNGLNLDESIFSFDHDNPLDKKEKNIIIYGHSINKEDWYVYDWIFEKYINIEEDVTWHIYFIDEKDKINKLNNLLKYNRKYFNMNPKVNFIKVTHQ